VNESDSDAPGAPVPSPDEEYVEGYATGYAEGLREALREILAHAARGHTVQELRMLIQSRLVRVPEDVDVKRRSLRGPPQRPSWRTTPRHLVGPSSPPAVPLTSGTTYLVREERPTQGPEIAARLARGHPRLLCVSVNPPTFPGTPAEKVTVLRPAPSQPGRDSFDDGLSLSELAGRIREAAEAPGGALVYVDAAEYLATEYGLEPTLKFVNWAVSHSVETHSTCVASVDPATWDSRSLRLLQRAFNVLV
jgi:uncharacterized protein DUF835